MSIICFPFLCIMSWTSVFESSNILGLQDIEMRQLKLFNAYFTVKTSKFRGCWIKEGNRQGAGLSDDVLNEGNAALEDPGDLPLFQWAWLISNICPSLVTCASLKRTKIKCSDSNCQVNDVLMLSWIATRLCRDAVRFEAAWLDRRELPDLQVSSFVFFRFLETTKETKAW